MLLIVFAVEFALPGRGTVRGLLQLHVDKCAAHLVAGGCVVHHFGFFYPACGDTPQQCVKLFDAEGGHFSVQNDGDTLPCQLQAAVHLGYTGKLLYGSVGIVHRQVADKLRQVIHQFALRGFDYGAFADNHHFGQALVDTVQAGIRGNDAVGAEGTFSAGDFLGGDAGTKKADY